VNKSDVAGLVLLDTWLRNRDRYFELHAETKENVNNVFLRSVHGGKDELIAMDFSAALRGSSELRADLLGVSHIKDDRVFGLFPAFRANMSGVDQALARLEAFRQTDAERIVYDCPREWLPQGEIRVKVTDFFVQRAAYLASRFRKTVSQLLNELPLGEP